MMTTMLPPQNSSGPNEQIRTARINGWYTVLAAALAAVVTFVGTVAYQEAAKERQGCAATPSRDNCDKKYASATGCEKDAITVPGGTAVRTVPAGRMVLELRWSRTCQTLWARAQPQNDVFFLQPWIEPDRKDATRFFAAGERTRGWLESPMAFIPGGNVAAKACSFAGRGRPDAQYACTAMLMPDGTDVTES
ncbi:DUF2690 domain-containing protein [Nonomuraea sp. NPDC049607]|uniref:DUF2690 domain-containing protein n=1 Tax=Nonomuraea sp. NPDC049607 TaxID=3154732 RepID=UPI00341582AE